MDNYFYGQIFSLQYKKAKDELTLGGSWTKYDGKHYGNSYLERAWVVFRKITGIIIILQQKQMRTFMQNGCMNLQLTGVGLLTCNTEM